MQPIPMRFVANDKLILAKKTRDPINLQERLKRKFYMLMPKKILWKLARRWPVLYHYDVEPFPDVFFSNTLKVTGHSIPLTSLMHSIADEDNSRGLPESLIAIFRLGAAIRGEGPLPVFPDDATYQCSNCGNCNTGEPNLEGGEEDPEKYH